MDRFRSILHVLATAAFALFIFGSSGARASSVDLTFAPVMDKNATGSVAGFVLQPDDRVIVFGDFQVVNGALSPRVARLNPDGSPDPTFACTICDFPVAGVLVQPDGKILVGGSSLPEPASDQASSRWHS